MTIADGGQLTPGASVGTLTVGSLVLNPGSQLGYELGLPDIVGGTTNDLIVVTGGLTLDGTLYIADAGGFSRGVYRLIDYGGALTDNGLLIGGLPSRFVAGDMLISTATAGEVNLIVSAGGFGLQFWDGPNTVGNGMIEGGTATWNNAATNWTAPDGSVNAPWQGGFAVFQGTAGTVTLGDDIAFEGMQFRSTGYVIDGGGFGLAAAPDTIIRVDPSVTATINAPIADGTGGAARSPRRAPGSSSSARATATAAAPRSTAARSRSAPTPVSGRLRGALGLDAGTLATTASFASARSVTLGENGGTFSTGAGTALTLGGTIGGLGTLAKTGAGTLILGGTNSYGGGTLLGAGVLAVSSDANLGAATGPLVLDGGTLRLDASFDPAASRAVTLGALGGTIDTNGNNSTFGQGDCRHRRAYQGGHRHAHAHRREQLCRRHHDQRRHAPDRQWRDDRQPHRRHRQQRRAGVRSFGPVTYAGAISGTGSVTIRGGGIATLTGINSHTGRTIVSAATLAIIPI